MKIELIIIGVTAFLWFSYRKYQKVKQDWLFMKREDFLKKYNTGL